MILIFVVFFYSPDLLYFSSDEKIGYLYGSILNIRGDIERLNVAVGFLIVGLGYILYQNSENGRISKEGMDEMRRNRLEDLARAEKIRLESRALMETNKIETRRSTYATLIISIVSAVAVAYSIISK